MHSLADAGRQQTSGSAVALLDELVVLSHQQEQRERGAHRKEMVHLQGHMHNVSLDSTPQSHSVHTPIRPRSHIPILGPGHIPMCKERLVYILYV